MSDNFENLRKKQAKSIQDNAKANYRALRKARRALKLLKSRDAINYRRLSPYDMVELETAIRGAREQVEKTKEAYTA